MDMHTYSPAAMPDLIRYQILAFMRTEWPQGFTGQRRGRRWISLPEFNPTHFVLTDSDLVVGHAESIWCDWAHQDVSYRVYGLSGVFVYPDYQGEGLGQRLVTAATDYCIDQPDADVGMLWCEPRLRPFYVRCGWEAMDTTTTLLGDTEAEAQTHDDEMLFMRFFSDHGQSHRADFENARVYFGWTTW